jgi:nicotinamidase-related amidase
MTNQTPQTFRSPMLMNAEDTVVVVVDMQEKLLPVIENGAALIGSVQRLIQGARILSVPVYFTEQYPEGLGKTVAALNSDETETVDPSIVFEKKMFSFRESVGLIDELKRAKARNLIFIGIEAHICVLQSALDAVAQGFNVFVCADGVGSRREHDRTIALSRLETSGVTLTTVESAIFELCETANHPQFKTLSQLVK